MATMRGYDESLVHQWETKDRGEWPVKVYRPLCSPSIERKFRDEVAQDPAKATPPTEGVCPLCKEISDLLTA